ncbi:MAG: phytanoyl-CoA dioxygenase family protein [Burkholderiaceae bacterium]
MPSSLGLRHSEVEAFHRDGYVLRKSLFDADEVAIMNDVIRNDPTIREATYARKDSSGASTELALWFTLGDDVFGAAARSERIVDSIEAVLGGPASFYHSKLTLKKPRVGGAWEWHQDYGYWQKSGFLYPHMASVFIAVEASTRSNGCLQVIRGSHLLGRVEHGTVGGQTGADLEAVNQALKVLDHVYIEMDPGDALFFHCNTLHASGRNDSENSRNVFLSCYNRADNAPYKSGPNISHTAITKLPDAMLAQYRDKSVRLTGAGFYKPDFAPG